MGIGTNADLERLRNISYSDLVSILKCLKPNQTPPEEHWRLVWSVYRAEIEENLPPDDTEDEEEIEKKIEPSEVQHWVDYITPDCSIIFRVFRTGGFLFIDSRTMGEVDLFNDQLPK